MASLDNVTQFPGGHAYELSKRIDDVNEAVRDLDNWVTRRFDRVDDNQVRTNDALASIQVTLTKLATEEETLTKAADRQMVVEEAGRNRRLSTRERVYAGVAATFTVFGVVITALSLVIH